VEVILVVQKFFSDGVMPDGVNDTTIVLIPKKDDPAELKDFRPISLCNVIFKVVLKCLVNWLRPLLQDIIAPMQSVKEHFLAKSIFGCLLSILRYLTILSQSNFSFR
jgi:hypothetical protein